MQNVILSLFVNGTMALLLLVTILYCWRLNMRIRVLQDSRSDLARIIREFDESTRRATQSIAEIHEATRRLSDNIQHKIDKANFLADDLQYMIEKGSKLAGKSEPVMPTPRPTPPPRTAPAAKEAVADPTPKGSAVAEALTGVGAAARRALRMRSRAEQELMQALNDKEK